MKQFLFILLTILAMSADAGKLKILFVNTKTINIGGKTLKEEVFSTKRRHSLGFAKSSDES